MAILGLCRYDPVCRNFQSKPCIQDDFAIPLGPGTGLRHLRLEASHATGSAAHFVAMSLAADLWRLWTLWLQGGPPLELNL